MQQFANKKSEEKIALVKKPSRDTISSYDYSQTLYTTQSLPIRPPIESHKRRSQHSDNQMVQDIYHRIRGCKGPLFSFICKAVKYSAWAFLLPFYLCLYAIPRMISLYFIPFGKKGISHGWSVCLSIVKIPINQMRRPLAKVSFFLITAISKAKHAIALILETVKCKLATVNKILHQLLISITGPLKSLFKPMKAIKSYMTKLPSQANEFIQAARLKFSRFPSLFMQKGRFLLASALTYIKGIPNKIGPWIKNVATLPKKGLSVLKQMIANIWKQISNVKTYGIKAKQFLIVNWNNLFSKIKTAPKKMTLKSEQIVLKIRAALKQLLNKIAVNASVPKKLLQRKFQAIPQWQTAINAQFYTFYNYVCNKVTWLSKIGYPFISKPADLLKILTTSIQYPMVKIYRPLRAYQARLKELLNKTLGTASGQMAPMGRRMALFYSKNQIARAWLRAILQYSMHLIREARSELKRKMKDHA